MYGAGHKNEPKPASPVERNEHGQLFGLFAISAMLVCYALEERSHWFVLTFAGACALGSAYGFLQGAWPFGLIEAIWSIVPLRRWSKATRRNK